MKINKKLLLLFSIFIFLIPINIFATELILGGENIGITVNTKEVVVVGFYKINNEYIAKNEGYLEGDKIIKINDKKIESINDLITTINNIEDKNNIIATVKRNNEELKLKLPLVKENDNYKTGLYIKDQITGLGTLTYINPETNKFAALGHEIIDSKNGKIVDIRNGTIYDSNITGIKKSTVTETGEKNATFNQNNAFGTIEKNSNKGIYGNYTIKTDENKLIETATKEEIVLGKAYIYTVLKNKSVQKYEINIIKLNNNQETKNILFEITDKELIDQTNGVIKGMSGSPIVQNDKLIGAVTHAIVNDTTKGYGIFIENMLNEENN